MKQILMFSLILAAMFLRISFAVEELGVRGEFVETRKNKSPDDREVVVRIYDNWEWDRADFEEVYVQSKDDRITLDFDNISEKAFVVLVKESQDDEYIKSRIGNFIYGSRYKKGLEFGFPRSGSYPYRLAFEDAFGIPFTEGHVKIFLYAKELGKDTGILVREGELDESGVFRAPPLYGDLNRFYVLVSRPDNYGYFEADSKSFGFYVNRRHETSATVRVPWVSKGTKTHERSVSGIVVDDANNPVSEASVRCNVVFRPDGGKIRVPYSEPAYKVLTDEQGWFELYLPTKSDDYIPLKSEYYVKIEATKEHRILTYSGRASNDSVQTIKLDSYDTYFHTFVFKDRDEPITDFDKLKFIRICVYPQDGPLQLYEYKDWKDGEYFPLGRYKAESYGDFEFEPLQVNEDSPEELVFEFGDEIVYSGKVVHGITKEPIKGAFVIAQIMGFHSGNTSLSIITQEQWDRLHSLESKISVDEEIFTRFMTGQGIDERGKMVRFEESDFPEKYRNLKPLRKFCVFEMGARTNSKGEFTIKVKPGDTFYSFVIIEENYLGVELLRQGLSADSKNHFTLPVVPLFPSAKVEIDLLVKERNLSVIPFWVIDVNSVPDWVGKPYVNEPYDEIFRWEDSNVTDSNSDFDWEQSSYETMLNPGVVLFYMLYEAFIKDTYSFFGIPIKVHRNYNPVWMSEPLPVDPGDKMVLLNEPFEEPREDPNRVPSFYEIYTGVFCKFTYQEGDYFPILGCVVVDVPAGLDLKLKIDRTYNHNHKWVGYTSPQITNLKQGQRLDLGVEEFKVAPQVFVKVVDSAGNPVEGISVEHWFEKKGRIYTEKTNEEGRAAFYVRHNCYGKFIVGSEKDGQGLYEAIAYKVGGEEDAGREFTMTLSDETLTHIFE